MIGEPLVGTRFVRRVALTLLSVLAGLLLGYFLSSLIASGPPPILIGIQVTGQIAGAAVFGFLAWRISPERALLTAITASVGIVIGGLLFAAVMILFDVLLPHANQDFFFITMDVLERVLPAIGCTSLGVMAWRGGGKRALMTGLSTIVGGFVGVHLILFVRFMLPTDESRMVSLQGSASLVDVLLVVIPTMLGVGCAMMAWRRVWTTALVAVCILAILIAAAQILMAR